MRTERRTLRPFEAQGRRAIAAILATFVVFSAASVTLSIRATERSRDRASVVQVAARQRTLAERYVQEVVLVLNGTQADPEALAEVLTASADALLDGGTAPAVNGDDDEVVLHPVTGAVVRAQLLQERRLVRDLVAYGEALLGDRPLDDVPETANENADVPDPVTKLRVLAALTSNVSLNAARTLAEETDDNVGDLIALQVGLGIASGLAALLLGWALIVATRRQSAHFRKLVTSSTDLVLVFGPDGCRYASDSVTSMLGVSSDALLGEGFMRFVHLDDRERVAAAWAGGPNHEMEFLVADRFGEWRHLEAHLTDLHDDRQIRGVLFNARDTTERVRLEHELTRQAFHDGLTGLANRALFQDRLEQGLAASARAHDSLAILLIDLDRFKQVNDTLGHGAGDELLRQLATRFSTVPRAADTLARLGGDEFAVLLSGTSEAAAVKIADRLLAQLREPVDIGDREVVLDASIGVVAHVGGHLAGEELVRRADVAMYAAKRSGGSRYEVFRMHMIEESSELFGLEHELRAALQNGEITVHYQPEIDLTSDEVVGAEALVRWTSPTRGAVSPEDFIPMAEETGLIHPLGELVLRHACQQAARWRDGGVSPDAFVMWVNLSGVQLSAGGVSQLVRHTLDLTGLPASCLGLEVTETAIVFKGEAGDRARVELDELHRLGVQIAIDDFGTGFSSLEQLKRFPIDVIKVDRSFIHGIENDAKSAAITANVASLAHALGLVTTAEGIETPAELELARSLGCDLAQGYYFARPAPAEDITELLRARRAAPRDAVPTA
ncbi:MAG: hypothetical protein JWO77_950 [Ilumatobacteraceae bacterium]|nr:hypothetical protein [Ilumatobacteraceae bacterium]